MNQKQRDEILIVIQEDISIIKRGVYGDKDNDTPGLMTRQGKDDEKFEVYQNQMLAMNTSIHANTKFRKKAGKVSKWITGGGATATVISIVAFYKQIREALVSFFD